MILITDLDQVRVFSISVLQSLKTMHESEHNTIRSNFPFSFISAHPIFSPSKGALFLARVSEKKLQHNLYPTYLYFETFDAFQFVNFR